MNKTMPVSLIKDDEIRLGVALENVHTYERARACRMHLHPRSSLVKRTSLVKKYPELVEQCATYYLPAVFALALDPEAEVVNGIYSGKREFCNPRERFVLNLKTLGMSDTDINQEFVVETKGSGLKLKYSKHLSEADVDNFLKRHKIKRRFRGILDDELVLSANPYKSFLIPEGGQYSLASCVTSAAYEYFLRLGYKLAPHINTVVLPTKVQELIAEFDDEEEALALWLSQDKRLMPSFVRGAYFEHNDDRNPEIVRMITTDEKHLRELTDVLVEDMVPFFESIAKTTERRGSSYYSDFLPTMDLVFDDPSKMEHKNYAWYVAKDMILANTGLYFPDLESALIDYRAGSGEEMEYQHYFYLTCLLKDFFRTLTHYIIAVEDTHDPEKQKAIERNARERIIERLNQSDFVAIGTTKNLIKVSIDYTLIKPREYMIQKQDVPTIAGGDV